MAWATEETVDRIVGKAIRQAKAATKETVQRKVNAISRRFIRMSNTRASSEYDSDDWRKLVEDFAAALEKL